MTNGKDIEIPVLHESTTPRPILRTNRGFNRNQINRLSLPIEINIDELHTTDSMKSRDPLNARSGK